MNKEPYVIRTDNVHRRSGSTRKYPEEIAHLSERLASAAFDRLPWYCGVPRPHEL